MGLFHVGSSEQVCGECGAHNGAHTMSCRYSSEPITGRPMPLPPESNRKTENAATKDDVRRIVREELQRFKGDDLRKIS